MSAIHPILLTVILLTGLFLWQQQLLARRLMSGLALLAGWVVVLAGLDWLEVSVTAVFRAGLWLAGWFFFLWGIGISWQIIAGGLVLGSVLTTLPFVPTEALLGWGLVTAVPLTALLHNHTRQPSASPAKRPVQLTSPLTTNLITSDHPILECLNEGVICTQADGLIVYVNQAATQMLNQPANTLINQPITDILPHLPMLAATQGEKFASEFEQNGRILQGQLNLLYDQTGQPNGMVAVLRDITEEERARTARDNFLTTISHELRTPLTVIKGYIELMVAGAGGPLSETQTKFLETIQRNVTRMVHLINGLLFATAIKSGRIEYTEGMTDFSRLIDQITRELQPKAAADGQQIITTIDPKLRPIQADPIHMATILEELLTNAIKYNKPQGHIYIQATPQPGNGEEQAFVIISIQDEGIGIEPEDQMLIFEGFYRPEKQERHIQTGGVGMGLSIVKALIEAYNGRIWLDSTPGKGSTFTFIIPTKQPDPTLPFLPK
ncbi:MAG: PAS domain-containing protein [Chloroflexi bacterium]|nr:MAG: PAS domain-containing protein [Chloroflexota bacterium]